MFYVYTRSRGFRKKVKIRLEDIPEYGLELEIPNASLGPFAPSAAIRPKDDIFIEPDINGSLRLSRDNDEILMSGSVHAVARLKCSRCLADYKIELSTEIDLVLKVTGLQSIEKEAELEDNEIPVQGPEIELSDIIFQEILLDVPMKPLCSEECPGLCPTCGAVLGSEQCKCGSDDRTDPRWLGLKKIKDQITS